jgi:hypothetical protein
LLDVRRQIVAETDGRRVLARGGFAGHVLHVAVEVVDGAVTGLEGALQPHVVGDVAGELDVVRVRFRGDGVEDLARHACGDLEQVIAGAHLLAHARASRLHVRGRAAAERGAGSDDPRAVDAATLDVLAQLQVKRVARHAADEGDALRQEHRQHVLGVLPALSLAGDVAVHLGQPGHDVVLALDDPAAVGNHRSVGLADPLDPPPGDDDRPVPEDLLAVHRRHVGVADHQRIVEQLRSEFRLRAAGGQQQAGQAGER